jgi:adenosylcobinamide amidohydrolase
MINSDRESYVTKHWIDVDTLVIDLGKRHTILSSAPRRGGLVRARFILNHQVSPNPNGSKPFTSSQSFCHPARYFGSLASRLSVDTHCVALMTAVPMKRLVRTREQRGTIWVEGFFTVGVCNAVKAGEPATYPFEIGSKTQADTINIIIVTNAGLTTSAMVGVVQVATESKAAVLLSQQVPSWKGLAVATGTGTDAVVIASGNGPMLQYSGTHTEMGELIGRLVSRGVLEGLIRWKDALRSSWPNHHGVQTARRR